MSEASSDQRPQHMNQDDLQRMEQDLVQHPRQWSNRLDQARAEVQSPESINNFVNTFKLWLAAELNSIRRGYLGSW